MLKYVLALLLGAIQIAQAAKGGGGGGSGGSGLAGGVKGPDSIGEGGDPDEEGDAPPPPAAKGTGSAVLKDFVLVLVVICLFICTAMFVLNWYKRTFREKHDIGSLMGLCLAQICNEEEANTHFVVQNGLGTNEEYIVQWIDDIWETYDFNDDGNIDKREIKKFIDQTFEKVNI